MSLLRPPGAIEDFDRRPALRDAYAEVWDQWLRLQIDARGAQQQRAFEAPILADPPAAIGIPWDAFPKALAEWYRGDRDGDERRWSTSETLRPVVIGVHSDDGSDVVASERQQDEYCEWFVVREAGRIKRIDFTCEAPEYWEFLADGTDALYRNGLPPGVTAFRGDLGLVHELYREYVDPSVEIDDLRVKREFRDARGLRHLVGQYDRYNVWNTQRGAMHLTHRANTLGAEIALAADGTVVYLADGQPVIDADALVCCAGFGDPNRSSDPKIGADVNGLARSGMAVALADPIGLYIKEVDADAFSGPTGWTFEDAWDPRLQRGSGQRVLRLSFVGSRDGSIPIEEILVNTLPISRGAQIADTIQMVLFGEEHGPATARTEACSQVCCPHPERPTFKAIASAGGCHLVPWQLHAPFEGTEEGVEGALAGGPRIDAFAATRA